MAELPKTRLETWKEVAGFFGRDERTVKRWEAERGLPIHRLPGAARSRIYAEVRELELWMKGAAGPSEEEPDAPAEAPSASVPPGKAPPLALLAASAAGLAAIAVAVGVALVWPRLGHAPAAPPQPPPLAAQKLYLAGMDDWSARTPESLHRAVDEFTQAIKLHSSYAEAYVGLANCYNLLREYTLMPESEAYPLARTAAQRALKLNDRLAGAHVALAFVYSYWDWDGPGAMREYERAIALDPGSDLNHHWFGTYLGARGDFQRAVAELDRALALNPGSLSIRSDRGMILYAAGRRREAIEQMQQVERMDPKFLSPHRYLSGIYLLEGRDGDYLRESQLTADMMGDRQRMALVDAARAGYARSGRRGMLSALLAAQLQQFRNGAASAYDVASTYALMGDDDKAMAYLQTAVDRREPEVVSLDADVVFNRLHPLPRFKALMARIGPESGPAGRAQNS
jgi:tetratricopeptide (TPR) repeat protein